MEFAHSKGKEKEAHLESKTPLYQMTEEKNYYNLTHHTITTTEHTTTIQIATVHTTTANRNKRRHPFIDDITETPFLSSGKLLPWNDMAETQNLMSM